jgi:hypothetical protein
MTLRYIAHYRIRPHRVRRLSDDEAVAMEPVEVAPGHPLHDQPIAPEALPWPRTTFYDTLHAFAQDHQEAARVIPRTSTALRCPPCSSNC